MLVIFLFLLFSSSCFTGSTFRPSDLPKGHWAHNAVMKLMEEGIIEKSDKFKGEATFSRYEIAVILVKLLSRTESLEIVLSGKQETTFSREEMIETIKKLIKEFQGEIETVKKIDPGVEKKITDAIKKIDDFAKEAKKEKKETDKKIKELERNIKKLEGQIETAREEQERISFSGENLTMLENIDYGASGMKEDAKFTMDDEGWAKTLGGPAPSSFSAYNSLLVKMKASPRLGIKTDKKIEINANLRVNYKGFLYGKMGVDYEHDFVIKEQGKFPIRFTTSPMYLESLNFSYSTPRGKFLNLSGGYISTGWTLLSLSMTGWNYQGYKAQALLGKNTADFVVANVTGGDLRGIKIKPVDWRGEEPEGGIEQKITYNETLYGMSILHSYGKANFLRVSLVQNKQDRDSFAAREEVRKLYQPDVNKIFSVFTRLAVMKNMSLTSEIAFSDHTQYEIAPYYFKDTNGNKIWDEDEIGERKILDETTPKINTKDSAFVALVDYNLRGISVLGGYARQNPYFRNRHGGVMDLISVMAGGGAGGLGGFDIGALLKGLQAFFSMTTYNPEFMKGLTIKNTFARGGEIEPSELSKIPDKLADLSESVAALNIDPDMDKRKNKIKLNVMMPEISYKPGAKTTLSLSFFTLKAGFDKDTVRGVRKGKDELTIKYQEENENLGNPLSSNDPYVEWQDPRSPTGMRQVFLHFDPAGKNEYMEYEYPIGSGIWQPPIPVNLTGGGSVNFTDSNYLLDIPGGAGQYVLVGSDKLGKLVDKPLELKLGVSNPKITLLHDFSKKLKYKFEYSTMEIAFDKGYLDTVDLKGAIVDFIKAEKTTIIKNKFNYELFRNISLTFEYNLEYRKTYEDVGGHKENKTQVIFTTKVVF